MKGKTGVHVAITTELYKEFKVLCVLENKRISEKVEELIKREVSKNAKK